jgi:hypothetical protein
LRFAAGHGIEATWTFHAGSPPTTNNKKLFDETIGTPRIRENAAISSLRKKPLPQRPRNAGAFFRRLDIAGLAGMLG